VTQGEQTEIARSLSALIARVCKTAGIAKGIFEAPSKLAEVSPPV
jgi:hypothetical protein